MIANWEGNRFRMRLDSDDHRLRKISTLKFNLVKHFPPEGTKILKHALYHAYEHAVIVWIQNDQLLFNTRPYSGTVVNLIQFLINNIVEKNRFKKINYRFIL